MTYIIKGIIFDLFGTLIRNEQLYRPICEHMSLYSENSPEQLEQVFHKLRGRYFTGYHDKPFAPERFYYLKILKEMVLQGLAKGDPEELVGLMYESFKTMPVYEDIDALQQISSRYPLCIITNADNDFAHPVVFENRVPHDVLITSEDARSYKPSIRIFELAADSLGLSRTDLVVIGDSLECDFFGPKKAGMKAILLDRKSKFPEISPRVRGLQEINSILPRI